MRMPGTRRSVPRTRRMRLMVRRKRDGAEEGGVKES